MDVEIAEDDLLRTGDPDVDRCALRRFLLELEDRIRDRWRFGHTADRQIGEESAARHPEHEPDEGEQGDENEGELTKHGTSGARSAVRGSGPESRSLAVRQPRGAWEGRRHLL